MSNYGKVEFLLLGESLGSSDCKELGSDEVIILKSNDVKEGLVQGDSLGSTDGIFL